MEKTLDEAWRKRAAGLPYASKRDALILASIIEKETAVRPSGTKVAAVFVNRLRIKMRLESDPTTIYGVTNGKGMQGRELTRADLQSSSPYNTYVVAGLPPGPICNPGRASILAAVAPAPRERSLYFVADGQGGHAFAEQHLRAQPQRRALEGDPAAEAGAGAQPQHPSAASACAAPQPQAMSHAGRAPGARVAGGPGARHLLVPARQPVERRADAAAASWCWLAVIGVGGLLIFGVRFLPELAAGAVRRSLGVLATGVDRALGAAASRAAASASRAAASAPKCTPPSSRPGSITRTGDVGGRVLQGRFAGRSLDDLADGRAAGAACRMCAATPIRCRCSSPISIAGWARTGARQQAPPPRSAHRHDTRTRRWPSWGWQKAPRRRKSAPRIAA